MSATGQLSELALPDGIRSRYADHVNGLRVHYLEAGFETTGRPCLLLLHGFPDLAFCWRRVMPALASAGYLVVAPDLRGYGRTTGWQADYDGDLSPFRMVNQVRDMIGLVAALGHTSVAAVIGHDFGSPLAAWSALIRPDIFRAVVMMSAPFAGVAPLPLGPLPGPQRPWAADPIHQELADLPRPRKHYQLYYSTREANGDMRFAPQGLHDFMRGYYHFKSADAPENQPFELAGWTAADIAQLPEYYVMDLDQTMAQTVAPHMPSAAAIAANPWLPDPELAQYVTEYARTGFQGGLQSYRIGTSGVFNAEMQIWAGCTIDVPSAFISGRQDWGNYQAPGALAAMRTRACTKMAGVHLIDGAGHWVQQEQPEQVAALLLEFLRDAAAACLPAPRPYRRQPAAAWMQRTS
jgi:pimeloyl-ACP methyl ester carboxylesterase